MESLYEDNKVILNNALSKAFKDLDKLYDLKYFDKSNYENNKKDMGLILVDEENGKLFGKDQVAMYMPNNSLCVKESILHNYKLDEEVIRTILLHELVHMASTNKEKGKTGFAHEAFPLVYNEGCTQYITLKLLYGDEIDKGLSSNTFYPESTSFIRKIVEGIGEEKLFNGFFEAKPRKSVDGFTPKELDVYIDSVMAMSMCNEEQMALDNMNQMNNNVEELTGGRLKN